MALLLGGLSPHLTSARALLAAASRGGPPGNRGGSKEEKGRPFGLAVFLAFLLITVAMLVLVAGRITGGCLSIGALALHVAPPAPAYWVIAWGTNSVCCADARVEGRFGPLNCSLL